MAGREGEREGGRQKRERGREGERRGREGGREGERARDLMTCNVTVHVG